MDLDWIVWMIIIGVGVVQIPFLADVVISLFPQLGVARFTQRIVTAVLVGSVVLLIFLALKQFVDGVLPRTSSPILHCVVIAWLWLNTLANYLGAVFLSAGKAHLNQSTDGHQNSSETREKNALPVCPSCQRLREKYTHHCSVCRHCVRLMDHHCPFTRNCVGIRNYAAFFAFLAYCLTGLLYASSATWMDFWKCWIAGKNVEFHSSQASHISIASHLEDLSCKDLGGSSFVFLPVILLMLMMLTFVIFHSSLLYLNVSTIDFFAACRGPWSELWTRLRQRSQSNSSVGSRAHLLLGMRSAWRFLVPGGLLVCVPSDSQPRTKLVWFLCQGHWYACTHACARRDTHTQTHTHTCTHARTHIHWKFLWYETQKKSTSKNVCIERCLKRSFILFGQYHNLKIYTSKFARHQDRGNG